MQHSHAFYSFIHRHRRACLIGGAMLGGVIIAAVVLYSILQNMGPAGTYPLTIAVVPGNATVHISAGPGKGNRLPSHGTAHLAPGEYTVQVERPGYSTYQQQVINDINLYAQKAGISVKGYTFEESSAASNAKSQGSASSSSAAAPAKPSSSGPSSARVVLAVDSPIAYDSLLKFLKLLNTSLPQIYLSELSLARNEHSGDAGRPVNLESLTLEVYLNK